MQKPDLKKNSFSNLSACAASTGQYFFADLTRAVTKCDLISPLPHSALTETSILNKDGYMDTQTNTLIQRQTG